MSGPALIQNVFGLLFQSAENMGDIYKPCFRVSDDIGRRL